MLAPIEAAFGRAANARLTRIAIPAASLPTACWAKPWPTEHREPGWPPPSDHTPRHTGRRWSRAPQHDQVRRTRGLRGALDQHP
jgi:hypothetical protein